MKRTIYLYQSGTETRVTLDTESYDRLLDSNRTEVIKRYGNVPVVKIF
ncbi:hypothetical protein [Haloarcula onubensis]|uniref:Uncharacterized protein n=1 Tax=Haloarcula onubensis TaxID=2950539 RepID=A0ABU2FSA6_9EURY|nr:hypothetical protein [Halomicroarcula sp. S3CR25-11]MDS0283132.1 hypothetical protein [Halomicroarcula sp. S3CR25-11]